MNTILVGYDLNKTGQDYTKLIEKLKEYGTYFHHLDSTWIIKTSETTSQVAAALAQLIDDNDELLVIGVKSGTAAWKGFDDSGDRWLEKHL